MVKWQKSISSTLALKKQFFCSARHQIAYKITCFTYYVYQSVSPWACECICLSISAVKSKNGTEMMENQSEESAIAFCVYSVAQVYLHAYMCACLCARTCACLCVCACVSACMYWVLLACTQLCGWVLHNWRIPLLTPANLLNLSDQTMKH